MTGVFSDRFVETLARLERYAEKHPEPVAGSSPLTIAISRQAGARGALIARAVGARLGWPVYDQELLTRISEEKGLHRRLLERLDERQVSWLEEMVTSFATSDGGRDGAYLRNLLEQLAMLGRAGHCVIVGRGGAQVLPQESTLRVRIIAPRPFRVAAVQKEQGIAAADAERWVDRTDQERARFIKAYFNRDAGDLQTYDLIINSGRFPVEDCAGLVAEAARLMEARLAARA